MIFIRISTKGYASKYTLYGVVCSLAPLLFFFFLKIILAYFEGKNGLRKIWFPRSWINFLLNCAQLEHNLIFHFYLLMKYFILLNV